MYMLRQRWPELQGLTMRARERFAAREAGANALPEDTCIKQKYGQFICRTDSAYSDNSTEGLADRPCSEQSASCR